MPNQNQPHQHQAAIDALRAEADKEADLAYSGSRFNRASMDRADKLEWAADFLAAQPAKSGVACTACDWRGPPEFHNGHVIDGYGDEQCNGDPLYQPQPDPEQSARERLTPDEWSFMKWCVLTVGKGYGASAHGRAEAARLTAKLDAAEADEQAGKNQTVRPERSRRPARRC